MYAGFGTVRPRVQIPGPRPILKSDWSIHALQQRAAGLERVTAVSQTSENSASPVRWKVTPDLRLNSRIAIR